jgi:acyl-CoA hydrolase
MERNAKTVAESRTEMTELALPGDSNPLGNLLGGRVMHWIDLAAAMAAARHAGNVAVTASMDRVTFLNPVKVGHVVHLVAELTWAGRTSMEVRVVVTSEDLLSGRVQPTSTAYLSFVAMGGDGKPTEVPSLLVADGDQAQYFREAEERRRERLNHRQHVIQAVKDLTSS